jgi:rfaE bifunctional protein kinase chain/domain
MRLSQNSEQVLSELRGQLGSGKRVVFVSGNFNVVHPGHVRLLQFAADCGDFLAVGVLDETSPGAAVPVEMRLEGVRAISLVDYAFVLRDTPERFIAELRPSVVVKGKEYENQLNPEKAAVDAYGGKLLFSSGEVRFSSLELIRREYMEANLSTVRKPAAFPLRHGFDIAELKSCLPRFNGMKVVVIGDLIVDEYIDCDPLGLSQEDPTVVVTPIDSKRFVGGAGIVAAHARGLGADVSYFSVAGNDDTYIFARDALSGFGVDCNIVLDESRPTTLKMRYRALGKTLLRVSELRQHAVRPEIADEILKSLSARIAGADLLIFSDFNYGCLPQHLVAAITNLAKTMKVPMVADSQASSQLSDISRFNGMLLITPTEREARLALRDGNSGLAVVAEALQKRAAAENVVITLGVQGILVYARRDAAWMMDLLPAFNTAPKDSAGAGDSFLACASMALCAGRSVWQSVYLGSLAAACQVARVGNSPLTPSDLVTEIDLP